VEGEVGEVVVVVAGKTFLVMTKMLAAFFTGSSF